MSGYTSVCLCLCLLLMSDFNSVCLYFSLLLVSDYRSVCLYLSLFLVSDYRSVCVCLSLLWMSGFRSVCICLRRTLVVWIEVSPYRFPSLLVSCCKPVCLYHSLLVMCFYKTYICLYHTLLLVSEYSFVCLCPSHIVDAWLQVCHFLSLSHC